MARFSGRQYRGALRTYRAEVRARAEERQAAEQARDAAREKQRRRRSKVLWNSRGGRARKSYDAVFDAALAERRT